MESDVVAESTNDMNVLYDDLEEDIYHQRDEELDENLKKATEEVKFYKSENEELQRLVKEQQKTITTLNKNISSLYLTSKRELDRKAAQMKVLSEELDGYILSGIRPVKRGRREEECHFPKRFKRDDSKDSYRTSRPPETDKQEEFHRVNNKTVSYNGHKTRQELGHQVDKKCTTQVDLTKESVPNNVIPKEAIKQVQGGNTDARKQIELQNNKAIQIKLKDDSIHSRKQNKPKDTFIHKIEPIQNDKIDKQVQKGSASPREQIKPNDDAFINEVEPIQKNGINIEMTTTDQVQESGTSSRGQSKPNSALNHNIEESKNDRINIEPTTEQVQESGTSSRGQSKPNSALNHNIEESKNDRINIEPTTEQVQESGTSSRGQSKPNSALNHNIEESKNDRINIEPTTEQVQEDSTSSRNQSEPNDVKSCNIKPRENNEIQVKTTIKQTQEDSTKSRKENNPKDTPKYKSESNRTSTKAIAIIQDQGDCFNSKKENQRDHNHNKNTGSDRIGNLQNIELKIDKSTTQDQNKTESQQSKEAEKLASDQSKGEPEKKPVWRIPKITGSEKSKKDQDKKLTRKENTTNHKEGNRTIKEDSKHTISKSGRTLNSQKNERKIDKPTKSNQREADNRSAESKRSKDKETTRKNVSDTEVKAQRTRKTEKERTEVQVENPVWKGDATDYKQVQQIIREGFATSQTVELKADKAAKDKQSNKNEDHPGTQSGRSKKVYNEETAKKEDMADSNRSSDAKLDGIDNSDKTSRPSACKTQKREVKTDKPTQKEPDIKEDTAGLALTISSDNPQHKIDKGIESDNQRPKSEESNNKETTRKDLEPQESNSRTQKESESGRQWSENETTKQRTESERSKKKGRDYNRRTSRERPERSQRGSDHERQNHNQDDRRKCKEDDTRRRQENDHHRRYEEDYRSRFEEVQKRYLESDWKRSDYDRKRYVENDRRRYEEYHRKRYEEYDRGRYMENDRRQPDVQRRCDTVDPRKYRETDRNRFDSNHRFKGNGLKKYEDDQKRRDSDPGRYSEDWRWFRSDREDYLRRNHESHRDYRSGFEERTRRLADDHRESGGSCGDGAGSPKAPFKENIEETRLSMDPSALLSLPEDHLEELLKSRQEKLKILEEMERKLSPPSLSEDNTLLDSCADQWDTNAVDEWFSPNKEEKPPTEIIKKIEKKSEEPTSNADLQKCKNKERNVDIEQKPNIEAVQVQETPNGKIDKTKLISDLLKSESVKLKCTRNCKHPTELENGKTTPESNSTKVSCDNKCQYDTGKKRNAPSGSPCKSKKQKMESIEVAVYVNEEQKNVRRKCTDVRDNIEPKLDMPSNTKEIEIEPDIEINNVNSTEHLKENPTEDANVSTDIIFKIAKDFNGGRILRVPKNKIVIKSAGDTDIIEIADSIDSIVISTNNSQNSNGPYPNKNISTEQSVRTISFKNAINRTPEMVTDVKVGNDTNVVDSGQIKKLETTKNEAPEKPVKNPRTNTRGKPKTKSKPKPKTKASPKAKPLRPRRSTSKNDSIETSLEVLFQQNEAPVRKSPRLLEKTLLERKQALALSVQSTPPHEMKSEAVKTPKSVKDVVYSLFGSMDSIIEEMEKEKKSSEDSTAKSDSTPPNVIILSDIKLKEGTPYLMGQIKAGARDQCKERIDNTVPVESKNPLKNVPLDKIAEDTVTTIPMKQPPGPICPETKSPKKKVTFDPKALTVTPSAGAPRRRITPIRISNSNATCCNDVAGLRLTQDGQIPLLNLEENHFNGVSTESIQENSIINLLHTMNVINFESNLANDLNTSVDSVANLTFSNFMDKISSTPNTVRQEETKEQPVQPSGTPSTSRPRPTGKRRRCKLVMVE